MKIEEYIGTLPPGILSGEDVSLSEESLRDIFRLAGLCPADVFYHLGCGDGGGVLMAAGEFGAKSVGIDTDPEKIGRARRRAGQDGIRADFVCGDVRDSDLSEATVILFWFADGEIVSSMMKKFAGLGPGVRIATVWGPLPGCLPHKAEFPYVVNRTPLDTSASLQEQLLAVFGVKCVDFVTAWEFAERYTKSIAGRVQNDRFLTILQTLVIWISARDLGVACGEDVPEPIRTYVGIMREHFGIDFGHLLR